MNILQVVQTFCQRSNLPVPVSLVGSLDGHAIQLLALLGKAAEDITARFYWTQIQTEVVFNSLGLESQGPVTSIATQGFKSIINKTFFDRTLQRPMYGPLNATQWQLRKTLPNPGPFYNYRIRGGLLLINPIPPAGHVLAFEYLSRYRFSDATGAALRSYPTVDTDLFLLDEEIFIACLSWLWLQAKGLDYTEDFTRYENMANDIASQDGTKPQINMSGGQPEIEPGIWVPSGNWPVS